MKYFIYTKDRKKFSYVNFSSALYGLPGMEDLITDGYEEVPYTLYLMYLLKIYWPTADFVNWLAKTLDRVKIR